MIDQNEKTILVLGALDELKRMGCIPEEWGDFLTAKGLATFDQLLDRDNMTGTVGREEITTIVAAQVGEDVELLSALAYCYLHDRDKVSQMAAKLF